MPSLPDAAPSAALRTLLSLTAADALSAATGFRGHTWNGWERAWRCAEVFPRVLEDVHRGLWAHTPPLG